MSKSLADLFMTYSSDNVKPLKTGLKMDDEEEGYVPKFDYSLIRKRSDRIGNILSMYSLPSFGQGIDALAPSGKSGDETGSEGNGAESGEADDSAQAGGKSYGWYVGPISYDKENVASVSEKDIKGNMKSELEEIFKKNNIHAKVTSFIRKPDEAGNAGDRSWHTKGKACDIEPTDGRTFDELRDELQNCNDFINYLIEHNYGVLEETDEETIEKYAATGYNFHIGPDKVAVDGLNDWLSRKCKDGGQLPERGSKEEEDAKSGWAEKMYGSYYKALKEKFGRKYGNEVYDRIALYMTAQSALESDWGMSDDALRRNNFAGYRTDDGRDAKFGSMDEFAKAHVGFMADKWPGFIEGRSFYDYIMSLFKGDYRYNGEEDPQEYWERFVNENGNEGVLSEVLRGMNRSLRMGGKFMRVRQIYERANEKGKR